MTDTKAMAGAETLLWIDLESTGTDSVLDEIIEIGAALTDLELNTLPDSRGSGPEFRVTVKPSEFAMKRMLADGTVRSMHEANGLLDECSQSPIGLAGAQDLILTWLHDFELLDWRRPRCALAGSGVGHFDRRFIDQHLPQLASQLVYPPMDVGVVRRFLRLNGITLPNLTAIKTHRALDDARIHLDEMRRYSELIRSHITIETSEDV